VQKECAEWPTCIGEDFQTSVASILRCHEDRGDVVVVHGLQATHSDQDTHNLLVSLVVAAVAVVVVGVNIINIQVCALDFAKHRSQTHCCSAGVRLRLILTL